MTGRIWIRGTELLYQGRFSYLAIERQFGKTNTCIILNARRPFQRDVCSKRGGILQCIGLAACRHVDVESRIQTRAKYSAGN